MKQLLVILLASVLLFSCKNQVLEPLPLPPSNGTGVATYNEVEIPIVWGGYSFTSTEEGDMYEFYLSTEDLKNYDDFIETDRMIYIKVISDMLGWDMLTNDTFEFKYDDGYITYNKSDLLSGSIRVAPGNNVKEFNIKITNFGLKDGSHISLTWSGEMALIRDVERE